MIITLSGGKQHGKDTFAEAIMRTHPELNFERRAFADAMKDLACDMLNVDRVTLEEYKVLEDFDILRIGEGTSMRTLLQHLGQHMKDMTGDNLIWCKVLINTMKDTSKNYIITDCRFPFEAEYVRDKAFDMGQIISVVQVVNPRVELSVDTHVSEQSFSEIDFDGMIVNHSTIEDLEELARELVSLMKKGEYNV